MLENGDLASVIANLASGTARLRQECSDGCPQDELVAIENLEGGPGPDVLIGDDHDNLLVGGPDSDELRGSAGHDAADGGPGDDLCTDIEDAASCERLR